MRSHIATIVDCDRFPKKKDISICLVVEFQSRCHLIIQFLTHFFNEKTTIDSTDTERTSRTNTHFNNFESVRIAIENKNRLKSTAIEIARRNGRLVSHYQIKYCIA